MFFIVYSKFGHFLIIGQKSDCIFLCANLLRDILFLIIKNGKKWRKLLIDILLDKLLEIGQF